MLGTVKFFDREKGYGFLVNDSGGEVFIGIRTLARCGLDTIARGDTLEYDVTSQPRGDAAENVRIVRRAAAMTYIQAASSEVQQATATRLPPPGERIPF